MLSVNTVRTTFKIFVVIHAIISIFDSVNFSLYTAKFKKFELHK